MYRLSPIQKHIWQLQADPDRSSYVASLKISMDTPVDPARLQAALKTVTAQNEILRTCFHFPPGMTIPLQVIQDEPAIPLRDSLPAAPPDNTGEALIRATFSGSQLTLEMPALLADAATLDLLARQLAEAYAGIFTPADEALQYADLAEWLNETLDDEDNQAEGEAWYHRIVAAPIVVRMPFERIPDNPAEFDPQVVSHRLSPEISGGLEALASQHGSTEEALFLAAFMALVQRLSGQNEFVLGLGCHGRTYTELEGALGPFARYLPFPAGVDPSRKIEDLLSGLSERVFEAFDHQEYFSWDVVENAGGDSPLPFFALNYEYAAPLPEIEAGGITFRVLERQAVNDRFNLKLAVVPHPGGPRLEFHYDAVLFDAVHIERLAGHFVRLLEGIAADPSHPLGAYSLVGPEEIGQFNRFNAGEGPFAPDATIVSLISAQAAKTPDAPAIRFNGEALTYAELAEQSDRLAAHLQGLEIGPGSFAGLFVKNSSEMFVGMLGILKSGAAYLPLDPEYPEERIAFMLEDTGAGVVLAQGSLMERAEALAPAAKIVDLSAALPESNTPERGPSPQDTAYVIYTSGSTGKPKGVRVSHFNLVHSTLARHRYYPEPVRNYLLLSSFGFDSSVAGIFWTLTTGGQLVLPEAGMARDARYVVDLIRQAGVTHTLALPSLYNLILDEDRSALESLQTVIVAGEACPVGLVEKHFDTLPDARLYNEYGPTEGTVWATVFDFAELDHPFAPIGKPVPGMQVHILNEYNRRAPLGVAGELCIAGPGVTGGYLNRPEETAARFVETEYGRLYRTGDLARWLPDGNIEFLGRVDSQVKIRGYRVELGEIEAVLGQHPVVQDAAVIVREDTPGDQRLTAYVTPAAAGERVEDLRVHLSQTLPSFMVPGAFIPLDRMPLTPSGKVDRNRLPAPDRARRGSSAPFAAPAGPVEEVLAGIWADLLGIDRIGRNDNFFELGGHSILVTQLVSRIREALPVDMPLRTIFDRPTIASLTENLLAGEHRADIERTAELTLQVMNMPEDELDDALR